ncbi:MAG: hypothetical protein ACLPVY_22770 [Acidimicrobiia bacterium]
MRRIAGLLLAAAMVLPVGLVASAAGAAGGTVCATTAGTATFTPPLPILSSKATVAGTLSAVGTVGKCAGGGVTSGHTTFKQTVKSTTGSNCTTLAKPSPTSKGTVGTLTITWNTGKTSTATSFAIKQTKLVTTATTTGKITAGLFVGSTVTGTVKYTLPKGACSAKPLATVTYAQAGNFTIK